LSANNPTKLEHAVRTHWAIENNLHWVLDIAFDEDSNRARKGHSAANLSIYQAYCFKPDKERENIKGWCKNKTLKSRLE